MKTPRILSRSACLFGLVIGCLLSADGAHAQVSDPPAGILKVTAGRVEVLAPNAQDWIGTREEVKLRPGFRIRTGTNSHASIQWSDNSVVSLKERSEVEVTTPPAGADSGLQLIRGLLSFFHREKPGRIRVITRGAAAGIHGTEFVMAFDPQTERTTVWVIDGVVDLTNSLGYVRLSNDQQGIADVGQQPREVTAGFIVNNLLQWCFYYPAVLDLRELPLSADEENTLAASLSAYRQGDLLAALANYPAGRQPQSESERIYHAALLLSVGNAEASETELNALAADKTARTTQLADALRHLIAAVKRETRTAPAGFQQNLASELLAASYYEQSRALGDETLKRALSLARAAATNSPEFGFAWTRVAELEFSFGRTAAALEALNKSLALTPRNAQALALKGFLLAAQNNSREALDWFDRALAVDSTLGNAWLGRGLVKIRRGHLAEGQADLLIAAAVEPRRAALRSYLGKAYAESNDPKHALHELDLTKSIDPNDPTAWLYSALVKAENNRINEAIRDLEHSQKLNENRSVYRSSLLLDQDRAVRSANLARVYSDAGLDEWSVREASRGLASDYGSYSSHLFLANSYNELRDPNRINLRYEAPAEVEYLMANLLAPVGAGVLSPAVSQQEYSRLLERNRPGFISATEYLSRNAWSESAAHFGTVGRLGYSLESFYRADHGQRPNNDFEEKAISVRVKQEITPDDVIYVQTSGFETHGGDVAQYFDSANARRDFRFREEQRPALIGGYRHTWSPGVQTLALVGRLQNEFDVYDPSQIVFVTASGTSGFSDKADIRMQERYESELELNSGELQQIFQSGDHTTVFGARFQAGDIHAREFQLNPSFFRPFFRKLPVVGETSTSFERLSGYAYHWWQLSEWLQINGGISYDALSYPDNFRAAPLSREQRESDGLFPKIGAIFTPISNSVMRLAHTRSIAGASIDQSFQLEPTQVAGFNQSFRSILPESISGADAGAKFETYQLAVEQRLLSGTYIAVGGEILSSEIHRSVGDFNLAGMETFFEKKQVREHLDFQESSVTASLNQLIGRDWWLGIQYRFSQARLDTALPQFSSEFSQSGFPTRRSLVAELHQVVGSIGYNHPCGFYAVAQASGYHQKNDDSVASAPNEDFWQLNASAGFRFLRRRVDISVGLLNIADQDYRLNPLNLHNELPRKRTAIVRAQFSF
jgi:Flp pilus assembly protein TadD